MREQIFTFGTYLRRIFGERVIKVPLSIGGFTCPNIDGSITRGGCTFCENDSISPSLNKTKALKGFHLSLTSEHNPYLERQLAQVEHQFGLLAPRLSAHKYLAYFQSFTNTYAPLETLRPLYTKALSLEGVVGISVGTRSDCITDETLAYLAELSQTHEVWIEFGIQSMYDATLRKINRGHDVANIVDAITRAKAHGLNVCGHLIYGLPDETSEMMIESTRQAYALGIDSVKYHPLYVVKRTALANSYAQGLFTPIEEEIYLEVLVEALRIKPPQISVQRISAGIDDETLLAPSWCRDKRSQVRALNRALEPWGLKY